VNESNVATVEGKLKVRQVHYLPKTFTTTLPECTNPGI